MIGRFVFSLFAFFVALSSFGADPVYYYCESASDGGYGYAWVSSFSDLSKPGYTFYPIEDMSEYWDNAPDSYVPYTDDPAYASYIPSSPPVGGGGGGGGDDAVGFDPASLFVGAGDVLGVLALSFGGLAIFASAIFLLFLAWRKFKVSARRI